MKLIILTKDFYKEGIMKQVAIYIRVSTDAQAKKGDSLGEQMETLKSYIDGHEDMILYDTYIDDGVSGQKLDRGEFKRLMDDVKAGRINLIVFTKLDRWFRSLRHYLNTQATLEKYHVEWTAVSQPFYDTTTPQGRAFVAQSMTFAELEAQNDSVRIKDVFDYKYKHGEVLSGKTPLGYSIKDKHLVPDEDAEKAVAVFDYYDKTNSLSATTLFLEREYGIVMSIENLKNSVLKNTKYIGLFRDNENFCPAIIDKNLFERVQTNLKHNVKSSAKRDYIFSGLMKCANCGRSMSGRVTKSKNKKYTYKYPSYTCRQAYPLRRCENRKIVFESKIEKYMLENVRTEAEKYIKEYETKEKPVKDQQKKRALIERKIERLKELYVNEVITLDELKKDREKLLQQLTEVPDEKPKDISKLKDFLNSDFETIYNTFDKKERRRFWRSVIKEIQVDKDRNFHIIFL